MKKIVFALVGFYSLGICAQEVHVEMFKSRITDDERTLRIGLPKIYDSDSLKEYPLIFCFDGDYLFYSVFGQSIPMAIADHIPEAVVVGIDQNLVGEGQTTSYRWIDGDYTKDGHLDASGKAFKDMLYKEILPFLDSTYRLSDFKVVMGHSFTGSLVHLLFMDGDSPFRGYASFSPYIPGSFNERFVEQVSKEEEVVLFYRNTGTFDLYGHVETIHVADSLLNYTSNENFVWKSDSIPNATHFNLTYLSVGQSLIFLFQYHSKLDWHKMEYYGTLENPINWYKERLEIAEDMGGQVSIDIDDLFILAYSFEEAENWNIILEIGEFTIEIFPKETYGYYMLGDAYMGIGDYQKALDAYEIGYSYLANDIVNKDQFYESITNAEEMLQRSED